VLDLERVLSLETQDDFMELTPARVDSPEIGGLKRNAEIVRGNQTTPSS